MARCNVCFWHFCQISLSCMLTRCRVGITATLLMRETLRFITLYFHTVTLRTTEPREIPCQAPVHILQALRR